MHLEKKNQIKKFILNVPGIPYGLLISKAENKPKNNMNESFWGKVQQIH